MKRTTLAAVAICAAALLNAPAFAAADDGPELIFKKNTVFRLLSPDAKLGTYVIDDPAVDGVACYFTQAEQGGWTGWAGLAEQTSDVSIACRQVGAVKINDKFKQGEDMYAARRSLFFKTLHIVRGCDAKRNVLVYLSYTDKLVNGSPKNSTSTVPIMPWGTDTTAPKCGDYVQP
jgi:CreA protein